jgi:hypothetical protein
MPTDDTFSGVGLADCSSDFRLLVEVLIGWEEFESMRVTVAVTVFDPGTMLVSSGDVDWEAAFNVNAGAGIALVMGSLTDEQADKRIIVAASAAIHFELRISKYPRQLIFRVDL